MTAGAKNRKAAPQMAVVIGARKFVFPHELQSCGRILWWGPTRDDDRVEFSPDGLKTIFVRAGLARKKEAENIAMATGAELIEFTDESGIVALLNQCLGIRNESGLEDVQAGNLPDDDLEPSQLLDGRDSVLKTERVLDVRVDRIRPMPGQPRQYFNAARLAALGRSIQRSGQRVAIIVSPVSGNPKCDYQIKDGERRWRASQLIHKPTLRAIVEEAADDAQLYEDSAISNFGREDHEPMEIATALRKIKNRRNVSVQDLADLFGRSAAWISQHLSLLRIGPEVQERMNPDLPDESRIGFLYALEISRLPLDEQDAVARHILSHRMNIYRTRHYIRTLIAKVGVAAGARIRKRDANDDRKMIEAFIERTALRIEELLAPPGCTYGQIFHARPRGEIDNYTAKLSAAIDGLKKMKQRIREA